MNKIVELMINLEEFGFEDLGVEIISLVDKPAIGVNWMAFARDQFVTRTPGESEDAYIGRCIPQLLKEGYAEDQAAAICYNSFNTEIKFRENPDCPDGFEHEMPDGTWMCGKTMGSYEEDGMTVKEMEEGILKIAGEGGEVINNEEIIYIDGTKAQFATIGDFLQGIRALDALSGVPENTEVDLRFRYTGPSPQRGFCRSLIALNRLYDISVIDQMSRFNPGMGPNGSNSYSVFEYKGGVNCQHYWEAIATYQNAGGQRVLLSLGPVTDEIASIDNIRGGRNAGESNNSSDPSPEGAVGNNASLKFWKFSDDDKQIVTGPAMIPNDLIDRRDDMGNHFHVYFSKDTIRQIAAKFLSDNNTHNTDVNHNNIVSDENTLLESWIVEDPKRDKSSALGFNVPKGTWMTSFKINNKETWTKIKAGELNGFSVEGQFIEKLVNV